MQAAGAFAASTPWQTCALVTQPASITTFRFSFVTGTGFRNTELIVIFFVRRQPHGVAVGGIWFAQNLFNIARYMADARARELPLTGGGEHDFEHIFTRWGVLHRDLDIASTTRTLGWIGIALALAWLGWRYRRQGTQA